MTWAAGFVVNRNSEISVEETSNNGVLTANLEIASELSAQGVESCLISRHSGPENYRIRDVPVLKLQGPTDEDLVSCLQQNGGCRTLFENSNATVFRLSPSTQNIVVMHNRHHLWGVETHGRNLYRLVDKVICVSEFSRRENVSWGMPDNLCTAILNGCNADVFYPRNTDREVQRIIFAGYCSPRKGIHIALDAFIALQRELPMATLHVCGKPSPWEPGPEKEQFQARGWLRSDGTLDWSKITDQYPGITYHGVLAPDRLAEEFSKSSVMVLPSRMDTFGLVSIEAQCCGCVPVLPVDGPFNESIHKAYGRFQYASDLTGDSAVDSLVTALRAFFEAAPIPEERIRAAEETRQKYSWANTAAQYINVINTAGRTGIGQQLLFRGVELLRQGRQWLSGRSHKGKPG